MIMNSLVLAIICFVLFIVAYHTYGKYLGEKIFKLDPDAKVPSSELRDDIDYVPTNKHILFGHHFTSIAGLAPLVGPALALIWGWVPALIWIVFGSIFMGAVQDFGSLVVSMRAKGRSVGDLVSDLINPRVRQLFLLIIFFLIWIVLAVFALIIAILFGMYPQAVFPVWLEIPIAVLLADKDARHVRYEQYHGLDDYPFHLFLYSLHSPGAKVAAAKRLYQCPPAFGCYRAPFYWGDSSPSNGCGTGP